jgi:hypothetical protein
MARFTCMLTALALGSVMISRPVVAQASSVSLTHTVSVTVPPRVKVQVSNAAPVAHSATRVSSTEATDGLSLSVNATQAWTLSIGSPAASSKVQWSLDKTSGFASVNGSNATVASGVLSQTPTSATVFFRNGTRGAASGGDDSEGSNAVMLTVVAP